MIEPWLATFEDNGSANIITEYRPLSASEYDTYKSATKTVLEWNSAQDRFSAIVSSYIQYRRVVQKAQAQLAAGREINLPSMRRDLNMHVVGFLAAFRTFLDQSDAYLAREYGHSSLERAAFKRATNYLYDHKFSYRLMDQLRNYTQHAGQAVGNVRYSRAMDQQTGQQSYTLDIVVERDTLLAYSRLKPSVRDEIQNGPQDIPLTVYMGAHVNSARSLHVAFTQQCASNLRSAATFIVSLTAPMKSMPGVPTIIDFAFTDREQDPNEPVEMKLDWPLTDFSKDVLRLLDTLLHQQ